MIEFVHDFLNFCIGHGRQVAVLRKILPDETVGILVQATFPGGTRMREIDTGIKISGHAFVVGKFPAVVVGNGMDPVDVRGKPFCNGVIETWLGMRPRRS